MATNAKISRKEGCYEGDFNVMTSFESGDIIPSFVCQNPCILCKLQSVDVELVDMSEGEIKHLSRFHVSAEYGNIIRETHTYTKTNQNGDRIHSYRICRQKMKK